MSRTFATEDARKTALFAAWISYLQEIHSRYSPFEEFVEVYQGVASVSDLSKNRVSLELEDGRKLKDLPISPKISTHTHRQDMMYIVIGYRKGKWRFLDVISIGTILEGTQQGAHMTFNPLYHGRLVPVRVEPGTSAMH